MYIYRESTFSHLQTTATPAGRGKERNFTVLLHQHLLLTHVLNVDCAVDDEVGGGAVVCRLLTLVTLDLQSQT